MVAVWADALGALAAHSALDLLSPDRTHQTRLGRLHRAAAKGKMGPIWL